MKQYDLYAGLPPHQKTSATSRAAAAQALPSISTVLGRILAFYRSRGVLGATNDEVVTHLGILIQTVCARKRELELKGLIVKTKAIRRTRTGRMAEVCVAAEFFPRWKGQDPEDGI